MSPLSAQVLRKKLLEQDLAHKNEFMAAKVISEEKKKTNLAFKTFHFQFTLVEKKG